MRDAQSTRLLACGLALTAITACQGSGGGPNYTASTGSSANTLDKGLCADSCPKPCDQDNDCVTSKGELCCDFGSDGKACVAAKECPRQCKSDTRCDAAHGEACARVTLESSARVCTDASLELRLCKSVDDCGGPNEVCCTAYREPVCLAADQCPKSCAAGSDCNKASGEVCCDTLPMVDKTLAPGGVCLGAGPVQCPHACKQSTDCDPMQLQGPLCCNGLCSDSCDRECKSSSDCSGQLCCKTRAARSPLRGGARRPGYGMGAVASGTCMPGSQSIPRSASDPCPQSGTACADGGFVAVTVCQADGSWRPFCDCVVGAPAGSAGFGAIGGGGGMGGVGGFGAPPGGGGFAGTAGGGGSVSTTGSVPECTNAAVVRGIEITCANCACINDTMAGLNCGNDEQCWNLVRCSAQNCGALQTSPDSSMFTSCVIEKCASAISGATAAMAIGTTIRARCMAQCKSLGCLGCGSGFL